MANVLFIGIYDDFSLGLRIMSSILKRNGHQSNILFFKKPEYSRISRPMAEPNNYEVFIKGYLNGSMIDVNPWTDGEIELLFSYINEKNPDIIGISSRSLYDIQIQPILKRIKAEFPDAWLIAGGFGPTLRPDNYYSIVDAVVFGEGEEAILDLAQAWDRKSGFHSVPNLIYFKNGQIVKNKIVKPEVDLDAYPFPDHSGSNIYFIDNNEIVQAEPNAKFYSTMAGRGCIGTCSYCSAGQWRHLYKEYGIVVPPRRIRSVDNVIEELVIAKQNNFTFIKFLDSFFVGPKDWIVSFLKRYKEEVNLPFYVVFSPVQLLKFPEIIDLAVDAGIDHTNVAVQSGDENFCEKYYFRNYSNDMLLSVAWEFHKRNVPLVYQFIAGNPLETESNLKTSLDFLGKMPYRFGIDTLQVFRLKRLPMSPIKKILDENSKAETSSKEWFYIGNLYGIRILVNDRLFKIIFNMKIFRQYPVMLMALHEALYKGRLIIKKLYRLSLAGSKKPNKELTVKAP
jgi:radical SAM superfamily enzyme YgiQ (UPF0313 family)